MRSFSKSCNFVISDIKEATSPYFPINMRLIKYRKMLVRNFELVALKVPFIDFSSIIRSREKRAYPEAPGIKANCETLNLNPGELVEIRSADEIFATLNEKGKYRGLFFMPEMQKFCGKRFKVYKKVSTISLESTGEMRKMLSPTVFLEGVFCDGEFHEKCDRSCFCFWKEVWLKRVSS